MLSGQGGGKSHAGGILAHYYATNYPNVFGFIGANTDNQLTDSTLKRVFDFLKNHCGIFEYDENTGQGHYVVDKRPPSHFKTDNHNFRHYRNKVSFFNGHVIFIGSLTNYKAHDGKEFAYAILDETKDTKEEAVKEVILGRLRQEGITKKGKPFNPLYILTSPAKVPWINEWFKLDQYEVEIREKIYSDKTFFSKSFDNKKVVIYSTYHNQKNLPSNYIDNQKANMTEELQDMLIYGNPFISAGGEFYKAFSRKANIKAIAYDGSLPLHITFDFNVNPYVTLNVWQVHNTEKFRITAQIDEICLKSPKNSTRDAVLEFMARYIGHQTGVLIYGDPNGYARDTRSERDMNDYTIIKSMLAAFFPSVKAIKKAPSVPARQSFMNLIFQKQYQGIAVFIAPHCKNTIADYTYLKEDRNGKKHKETVKDPNTGITYEKYGHTSDANDYFFTRYFEAEFKAFKKGIGLWKE